MYTIDTKACNQLLLSIHFCVQKGSSLTLASECGSDKAPLYKISMQCCCSGGVLTVFYVPLRCAVYIADSCACHCKAIEIGSIRTLLITFAYIHYQAESVEMLVSFFI